MKKRIMNGKELIVDQLQFYRTLGVTHLRIAAPSAADIEEGINNCRACDLGFEQRGRISGWGNSAADLMFIVDAPSGEDVQAGVPLGGEAGRLLEKIIQAIGLRPEEVFITNVVKCCPSESRKPSLSEIEACRAWLIKQISLVNPSVVVPLGNAAAQSLFRNTDTISELRGRFYSLGRQLIMPTFHPEYLLHNPGAKAQVWHDMKMVRSRLK